MGFRSVMWERSSFFTGFHGRNLVKDDQSFKRGTEVKKGGEINIKGKGIGVFSSCISIVTFVPFCFCFCRYYTKGGIPRKKLMTALLF